jgi:hypothetical protein
MGGKTAQIYKADGYLSVDGNCKLLMNETVNVKDKRDMKYLTYYLNNDNSLKSSHGVYGVY